MASVTYIAKRRLIPGRIVGFEYDLDIEPAVLDLSDEADSSAHISLSGKTETVFNRLDETWSVTTVPLDMAGMLAFREFLASASDGQTITFDPYGTANAPVLRVSAILTSSNHTPIRQGTINLFVYSFTVRVIE
jgi:hypothetical protein